MRHLALLVAFLFLLPLAALAQDQEESDGGFLTRTIENALSGAGREVRITGFRGALSSEASFTRMTIADAEGIWLTLDDVVLNWSRLALLRGRLEVDSLTAQSLTMPRLPQVEETEELPSAEASGFSFELPELPVSVNIGTFEVARIELGEPIIGTAVALSIAASARLDDDGLNVDMSAERVDDVAGILALQANVERDGAAITIDLELTEDPDGITSRLLNLPGQPSVGLKVAGTGPLDNFSADIDLLTDGAPRLDGQVTLIAEASETEEGAPDRRIRATLGGDISALIAPEYQDFFGPDVALDVNTLLLASGAIDVEDFAVAAQAVDLSGSVRLNSDKWPEFIDVNGRVAQQDGPVVLPGSDAGITIGAVDLDVKYDASNDSSLAGRFDITEFVHDAVRVERTQLVLDGQLEADVDSVGELLADLTLDATGIALADADVARAVGGSITGSASIAFVEDQPFEISDLILDGADFGLVGDVVIDEFTAGFPTQLDVLLKAEDLSRFAALAGQELAGGADLSVAGQVTPLAGTFDLKIAGKTTNLAVGIEQADAVMRGVTDLTLGAARDETGTFVRDLKLVNPALDVAGDVALRTEATEFDLLAKLADVALVLPQYQGALTVDAVGKQTEQGLTVQAVANAPYDTVLEIAGLATGPDADIEFDLSVPEVSPYVATLEGPLMARGRVMQSPKGYMVDVTADGPFASQVAVQGLATGPDANVSLQASMPDISVFVPDIPGPLRIDGDVARAGDRWRISTMVEGPSGTTADVAGNVAADASDVDLTVVGQLPLGLSRPFLAPNVLAGQAQFDLAVRGAPGLDAVSGRITTNGASFTAPDLRVGLNDIATTVNLSGGSARIEATTALSTGGQINANGSINLTSLAADLAIALRGAVLTDRSLYAATLNGDINVNGPLTGGARIAGTINLSEVNVTVPSSGITSIGEIPDIRHIGSSREAIKTRARAGVLDADQSAAAQRASSGPVYPLNVVVNAPSRIFVRGRGIEAELGGSLEITGNTNNIISAGGFDLIRGRFDIIGKRFQLDEGSIQFQGSVVPYILFVSVTEIPDGTASISVEGLADDPQITFSAVPEAPEDEVLALIIFGRSISELSAFQTLQLANGIAQLTGTGGVDLIGNLRRGIGLDELNITTTDSGATEVTAGRYLTEDIYTDVTNSSEGGTDVSLNIDLTRDLSAKATVGSTGESSIGLFFERDF